MPVPIATAFEIPDTNTGLKRVVLVPSPTSPSKFPPQHFAPPPDNTAHEYQEPALIETAVEIPDTKTGVNRPLLVPSPK